MSRNSTAATLAFLALVASSGIASAQAIQPWANSGLLECSGGPTTAFLVGAEAKLTCVFHRPHQRHAERYVAAVHRVGFDIGTTDKLVLAWDVMTPSGRVPRGGLTGNYGGAGASAAVAGGSGSAANA